MNPSEAERSGVRPFFLYRLPGGQLQWMLTEDHLPHGARFVFRVVCQSIEQAIQAAKEAGKLK